jgi:hypothetical protein
MTSMISSSGTPSFPPNIFRSIRNHNLPQSVPLFD